MGVVEELEDRVLRAVAVERVGVLVAGDDEVLPPPEAAAGPRSS
jgi:hypothetical protein